MDAFLNPLFYTHESDATLITHKKTVSNSLLKQMIREMEMHLLIGLKCSSKLCSITDSFLNDWFNSSKFCLYSELILALNNCLVVPPHCLC